ncbi:alpha/beta fold hydrolase [Candidatus Magnetominusculus xianensis]|uniref:3-oxoadipate enol-lactonase n=1 Tax=Candidatus Magnetominusculus xianensis TaxID=1748249 RepID=A0ABR5SIV0_9BACT|nr:alpha/beta hydrolase [Candidatus Magnetominusculus xianensis]KWT85148.1 3-oxoadipate enol-lactonase [Candidatus Magnetominusculus xianensis]MBF0405406.1 alpha/beta hydrolase [Nitrospirota bacterium]
MNSLFTHTSKGDEVGYLKHGSGPRKVIFIHGNLASSLWWRKSLQLIRPGYEAYALDLPGSGGTPETRSRHTLDYLASFVNDFADALRLNRFYLAGHSMGGGIAQLFAINYPEKIEKLVLINSIAMDGLALGFDYDDNMMRAIMQNEPMLRHWLRAVMPGMSDDEMFEQILAHALKSSEQVFVEHPRAMSEANWTDRIHKIKCPALFIHGAWDDLIPKVGSERTARAIAECQLTYLENCGHSPMLEAPQAFNDLIFDFFEK